MRITHAELLERTERCARGLIALGLRPGERVALLLENSPEFLISFFAIAACRGVAVPLNLDYKGEDLRFYLGDAAPRCLIVDSAQAPLALQAAATLPHPPLVLVNGPPVAGTQALADLARQPPDAAFPAGSPDDELIYIYTSGSTGRPKCAPRTILQYWWEMDHVIERLRLDRHDTIFCMIPLFHNFGAVHCMLAPIGSGARLVILDNATPFVLHRMRALRLMERERVTILPGVPFQFSHLAGTSGDIDLSTVRHCYAGAAVLASDVADAFRARFGVPVGVDYGCTEVGGMAIKLHDDGLLEDQSSGRAFPGVRIRILDDAGRDLPPGDVGEVVVASRAMTSGYRGASEEGSALFRNGYYHTGDLGALDAAGRLFLRGRMKHLIDVVGHKVSPIEIEDVLAAHPAVSAAVVLGIPGSGDGDVQVTAYVAARCDCAPEELLGFCCSRLAGYKVPQSVKFIREVPRDGLGKTLRKREVLDARVVQQSEPARERELAR